MYIFNKNICYLNIIFFWGGTLHFNSPLWEGHVLRVDICHISLPFLTLQRNMHLDVNHQAYV